MLDKYQLNCVSRRGVRQLDAIAHQLSQINANPGSNFLPRDEVMDARLPFRRKPTYDLNKRRIVEGLLRDVWDIAHPERVPDSKIASCLYHYESLLADTRLLDDDTTAIRNSANQSSEVIALLQLIRRNRHSPIADIYTQLRANRPHWLLDDSQDVLENVLQFAVRLWLFTQPDLSDPKHTLQEAVRQPLRKGSTSYGMFWHDFTAVSLARRGDFHIAYTSDVQEHLAFASKSVIRVFAHASILEWLETSSDG